MASYLELYELSSSNLRNKIASATAVAAAAIFAESVPVPARVTWSEEAIKSPESKVEDMIWYLLATNANLTKSQIESAADSAILSAVNDAIDKRVAPAT